MGECQQSILPKSGKSKSRQKRIRAHENRKKGQTEEPCMGDHNCQDIGGEDSRPPNSTNANAQIQSKEFLPSGFPCSAETEQLPIIYTDKTEQFPVISSISKLERRASPLQGCPVPCLSLPAPGVPSWVMGWYLWDTSSEECTSGCFLHENRVYF